MDTSLYSFWLAYTYTHLQHALHPTCSSAEWYKVNVAQYCLRRVVGLIAYKRAKLRIFWCYYFVPHSPGVSRFITVLYAFDILDPSNPKDACHLRF